jgi:ATP-dependent HslUV protease, peptidase subunit HslV
MIWSYIIGYDNRQDDMTQVNLHGTTILSVRKDNIVAIAADGQVTFGNTIMKATAKKLRSLAGGKICAGFAGSTADALTLYERLEEKLDKYNGQLTRACVELAKDWRTDKYLRRLEAMMIVVDKDISLVLTGNGDVLDPDSGVVAIGSGGNFAKAAALALLDVDGYDAVAIVKKAMNITAEICIHSNNNIIIETIV